MFSCSAQRERWAESHASLTGHSRWLIDDLPRTPDIRSRAWTPLGLAIPAGHEMAMTPGWPFNRFQCSCGIDISARFGRAPHHWYDPAQIAIDEAHAA